MKQMLLKVYQNSYGNTSARVSFLMAATSLKKRLWNSFFPVNFTQFLRTIFKQVKIEKLLSQNKLPR